MPRRRDSADYVGELEHRRDALVRDVGVDQQDQARAQRRKTAGVRIESGGGAVKDPAQTVNDIFAVNDDLGAISSVLYSEKR